MKQLLWREQCMDTERRKSAPAPAKPQAEGVTIPTVAVSHAEPGLRVQDIPTEVYKVGTTLVNTCGRSSSAILFRVFNALFIFKLENCPKKCVKIYFVFKYNCTLYQQATLNFVHSSLIYHVSRSRLGLRTPPSTTCWSRSGGRWRSTSPTRAPPAPPCPASQLPRQLDQLGPQLARARGTGGSAGPSPPASAAPPPRPRSTLPPR